MTRHIQAIIDGLNQKQYAQLGGQVQFDDRELTEEERTLIRLYEPHNALISYGTLAPNRVNHYVVESIPGSWQPGIIRGQLVSEGWGADLGYNGFRPVPGPGQPAIPVWVLRSTDLAAHWSRLDAFEGAGYRRILVSFMLDDGTLGVGHLYALTEPSS